VPINFEFKAVDDKTSYTL
jgi:hypothetical protein